MTDARELAMVGKLTDRLRGKYPIGPEHEGAPEFGYREFPVPPIQIEAAAEIERLAAENEAGKRLAENVSAFIEWVEQQADTLDDGLAKGAIATQGSMALTAALVWLEVRIAGPDMAGDPSPEQYIERCKQLDAALRADRDRLAAELSDRDATIARLNTTLQHYGDGGNEGPSAWAFIDEHLKLKAELARAWELLEGKKP